MMTILGNDRDTPEPSSLQDRAIIIADRDGVIRVWGGGAARLFGYSIREAVGQRLDLIVPADFRAEHWRGFHAAFGSGSAKSEKHFFTAPVLCRTGEVKSFRGQFHLLRDETGGVIAVMAIFTHWTERSAAS